MKLEMNAEYDGELAAPVQEVAQAAVDAVATAYAGDAGLDVEGQLTVELSRRGIRSVDPSWADEIAVRIRSGHHVRFGDPDGPLT
jgi:hypothetical protein